MNKIQRAKYVKLFQISEMILDMYNVIKENEYNGIDNKKNIENLKIMIEYESLLYTKDKIDQEDCGEISKLLDNIYLENDIYESIEDISSHKTFNISTAEKNELINLRIASKLEMFVVNNFEFDSSLDKLPETLSIADLENYTGIYVDKFEYQDKLCEDYIVDIICGKEDYKKELKKQEDSIEYYGNKVYSGFAADYDDDYEEDEEEKIAYAERMNALEQGKVSKVNKNRLDIAIKKYKEAIKDRKRVLAFNENFKIELEIKTVADFYLKYIRLINKDDSLNKITVLNTIYNLSYTDTVIETKMLQADFIPSNVVDYLNQYDYSESNAHFMNIYYTDLSFKIIIDIMNKLFSESKITKFDIARFYLASDLFYEEVLELIIEIKSINHDFDKKDILKRKVYKRLLI